jgi:hypothetical protein
MVLLNTAREIGASRRCSRLGRFEQLVHRYAGWRAIRLSQTLCSCTAITAEETLLHFIRESDTDLADGHPCEQRARHGANSWSAQRQLFSTKDFRTLRGRPQTAACAPKTPPTRGSTCAIGLWERG